MAAPSSSPGPILSTWASGSAMPALMATEAMEQKPRRKGLCFPDIRLMASPGRAMSSPPTLPRAQPLSLATP